MFSDEENKHKFEKHPKRQRFNDGEPNFTDKDFLRVTFQNKMKYRSQGLSVLTSIRNILKLDPSEITGTVR